MTRLENKFPESRICIIDDDAENVRLIKTILELNGYSNFIGITDSKSAVGILETYRPDLVVLDMHMPPPDGHAILDAIRHKIFPGEYLPVIALTGDSSSETKKKTLEAGASDFLVKPADVIEITLRIRNFLEARHMYEQLNRYKDHLEEVVQERTADLYETHRKALDALARAAEFRDDATGEHTKRVGELSAQIAKTMGLDHETVEGIRLTAPLHDVGKIAIPDNVLLKPGKLDESEFELVKLHTTVGAQLLSIINSNDMKLASEIALSHHEKWNGTGYPDGLKGEAIPLPARIVAAADVFDALTHQRPYKKAWTKQEALDEIERLSEIQFDPEVVKALLSLKSNEDVSRN